MKCNICLKDCDKDKEQLISNAKYMLSNINDISVKTKWMMNGEICLKCSNLYSNEMITGFLLISERQKNANLANKNGNDKLEVNISGSKSVKNSSIQKEIMLKEKQKYIQRAEQKATQSINAFIKKPDLKKGNYSAEYIQYLERGESAAVFIVRDFVKALNTKSMWIDVSIISRNSKSNIFNDFNFIVVELFNRKINPTYPKKEQGVTDEDYRHQLAYLTWETANEDIQNQKASNIKGKRYLIIPKLVKEKKSTVEIHGVAWDAKNKIYKRVDSSSEKVEIKLPLKWTYSILGLKKLNDQQFSDLSSNLNSIDKILKNSKPTIDLILRKNK